MPWRKYKEEIRKEIPRRWMRSLEPIPYEDIVNAITEALGGKFYENFGDAGGLPKLQPSGA